MKIVQPNRSSLMFGKNTGLRAYLSHVEKGQPDIYSTPFVKGTTLNALVQDWLKTLAQIKDEWPTLWEFENDLAKKVGPMSVMKPLSERMPDIEAYYTCVNLPQVPISDEAIRSVLTEYSRFRGLRIRSITRTVDVMKKSTNSGLPFFTKRRNVVDKTIPCVQIKDGEVSSTPSGDWTNCAVLGWRGQEGGPKIDDVKQRVVWMFPFAVNANELQCYQPLIEALQSGSSPAVPAWKSMEAVDMAITNLFDTKGRDDLIVCTDFSKFDQHFNPVMQECARSILSGMFTDDAAFNEWITNVFHIKYSIPLLLSEKQMVLGKHGMGSGSGGTNADETLTHRALQHEVAIKHNAKLNPNSQCLGDDGLLTYPGITVEDVVESYSSHGQEMNPDKQYASKHDCVYLRRWHHTDYRVDGVAVGVYSTCRAIGRLAMQERFYDPDLWSAEAVALRQLSIIENCKWHPLREQFVNWCMKRDKYRLGIDIPGFLSNIEERAREYTEHMPDFLGYTKSMQTEDDGVSGIQNWWIVKYLKSIA